MNQTWSVVFPLVKPQVKSLAKVAVAFGVVSLLLWGGKYFLTPGWQNAQAALQSAQAQLDAAQQEQSDVATHWPRYQQLIAAGLIGGEPRATWVDDLLQRVKALELSDHVSFALAAPEPVTMSEEGQDSEVQASVNRHVLEIQMNKVHELEALRLIQQVRERHRLVTQHAGCAFFDPQPEGLTAQCRINFLHIDLTSSRDKNDPS